MEQINYKNQQYDVIKEISVLKGDEREIHLVCIAFHGIDVPKEPTLNISNSGVSS